MKIGKHTLIIDGNYFLHSRLFVIPSAKNKQLLGDVEGQAQLMRKLCIDFASEVRKMTPFVDQIVVAVDSKSWRKDLFPEAEYKGTRVADDSVNWTNVFNVYTEFQDILAKQGVIIHKVPGAEADDILFGWSTLLNNEGKNCIVWTGDRDLIQLVDYNNATDSYTLWYYSSKRKLLAFEGFQNLLDNADVVELSNDDLLFNMGSSDVLNDTLKNEFNNWITSNNVEIEEINCDDFIFSKIIQGDRSDNIKSVISWTKTNNNGSIRNYSITEKQAIQILEKYKELEGTFHIDHFFTEAQVKTMVDIMHDVVGKSTIDEIRIRFNQNLDLMLLHHNTIPDGIQKAIYSEIDKDFNIETRLSRLTQADHILEGTRWHNISKIGGGAPKGSDPFASLKVEYIEKQIEQLENNRLNSLW